MSVLLKKLIYLVNIARALLGFASNKYVASRSYFLKALKTYL